MDLDSDAIKAGKAYVEHVGVKGMKWGVRKSRSAKRAAAREAEKNAVSDHKVARQLAKKGLKNLTNDELRVLNQRLQLEQQFVKLSPPSASARKRAKIERVIKNLQLADQAFNTVTNGAIGKALIKKGEATMGTKRAQKVVSKNLEKMAKGGTFS